MWFKNIYETTISNYDSKKIVKPQYVNVVLNIFLKNFKSQSSIMVFYT